MPYSLFTDLQYRHSANSFVTILINSYRFGAVLTLS